MALGAAAAGGIRRRNRANYCIVQIVTEQPEAPSRQLQSSTSWHDFIAIAPLLLELVQVHFHDSSPFDTHPANMWIAVFAGLICCIALRKNMTESSRSFGNVCVQVGYVSGLLASVALISVVVPPSFGPFVFVIWMVASIMLVNITRNWILRMAKKLFHLAKNAISYVHDTWKQTIGNNDNVGAIALPV